MTLQRNHYEVLGVPRKASTDEIKKKYREMARKFHPDVANDKTTAQKVFSQINQAYRILADPDRRAQYDAVMAAETTERPAVSTNGTGLSATRPAQTLDPQQSANVARLVAEAETAMLQGNIGKVKTICELVIKTDPRSQKALGLLGDALTQMGKRQEAAEAYHKALQIAPSFALQAKLNRLTGAATTNGTSHGTPPSPRPSPPTPYSPSSGAVPTTPTNGPVPAAPTNGAKGNGQSRTDEGRTDKQSGGFFSRLLGRK